MGESCHYAMFRIINSCECFKQLYNKAILFQRKHDVVTRLQLANFSHWA